MRRLLPLLLFVAMFTTTTAFADPGIRVYYQQELLRVTLDGSYAGAYYQVWRSGDLVGQYNPLASQYTLCTGDCFLTDQQVRPGQTYYYRFDLQGPSGEFVTYGPYAVTVPDTPLGARVWPNPSRAAVRVELSLPGSRRSDSAVQADARVVDLQGRTVRMLHSGALPRGVTSLAWDGRGDAGQQLGAGIYFVRLTTPLGSSSIRVVRFR
jgi:hypothetical protein